MAANDEMVRMAKRRAAMEEFLATTRDNASVYEEEPVREALRTLATKLRAISDEYGGELGAYARLAWLDSLLPLEGAEDLVRALSHVEAVVQFVYNWSDCVRSGTPRGARASAEMAERYESAAFTVAEYLEHVGGEQAPFPEGFSSALYIQGRDILVPLLKKKAAEAQTIADSAEEDASEKFIDPARAAADEAMAALLVLVDAMRDRAPEELR